MLTYIAAKFLIKGAVKSLLVQPAISATLSVLPQANLIQYSLLGKNLSLSTTDLLKFGIEKLYEHYGDQKLDFAITKRSKTIYQVVPANELAARFFKEYSDVDELMIDLDAVDDYLDLLYDEDLKYIEGIEEEIFDGYEAVFQLLHDLDQTLDHAPVNTFDSHKREQQLIDEVIEKNMKLVEHSTKKLELKQISRNSDDISPFDELPGVKFRPRTEKQEIDAILAKFTDKTSKTSSRRRKKSKLN